MKPVRGAPTLFQFNGFGTSMFGHRNPDAATGTYIKTLMVTLLFIPVIPISSYRVADAPGGGWYFIGKERISPFARMMRATLLVGVIFLAVGIYSSAQRNSPDAKFERALAVAEKAAANGDMLEAAIAAQSAIDEHPARDAEALALMDGYLDAALESSSPRTVLRAFQLARDSRHGSSHFRARSEDLEKLMLEKAAEFLEEDPHLALEFASCARQVDGGNAAWVAPMRTALESITAAGDESIAEVVQLAGLYSDLGESTAIIRLLEPRSPFDATPRLGVELGRAYLREGRAVEAAELLDTHTRQRYPSWVELNKRLEHEWENAYNAGLATLNDGLAPKPFYDAYETATEAQREAMVDRYLDDAIRNHRGVRLVETELETLGNLGAVMMDLGVACIEAGHAAPPDQREGWFERAEKTFLSLREHAGESAEFQFFYGQVCYWLGKSREGSALFDQLIADHGDDAGLLIEMGVILRGVGEADKARDVYRKALAATDDPELRTACIVPLAILAESVDERIEVLESGDATVPRIAIDLAEARATMALNNGDRDAALALYREALGGYGRMPENSTTLNNAALIHFHIFDINGAHSDYAEGLRKLEAAVALEPNDSILCHNAASRLLTSATATMLAEAFGPEWLPLSRGVENLRLLYDDEAGRDAVIARYTAHPHYARGRALLDRALVLAPESRALLAEALTLAGVTRDTALAANLHNRLKTARETTTPPPIEDWIAEIHAADEDREKLIETFGKTAEWFAAARERVPQSHARSILDIREISMQLGMDFWMPDLDAAALHQTAAAALDAWPCSESRGVVSASEALLAWRELCAAHPAIAEWAGDALRMLPAREMILLAAMRFDEARTDAAVRAAFSSMLDHSRRFPSSYSPQDVVIADLLESADRDAILASARSHPTADLHGSYSALVAPHAPGTAVQRMFLDWLTDGQAAAVDAYRAAAAENPWLPEI